MVKMVEIMDIQEMIIDIMGNKSILIVIIYQIWMATCGIFYILDNKTMCVLQYFIYTQLQTK